MKYITHSSDSEEIQIKTIENGFIVSYRSIFNKEAYVENLEELYKFLQKYYINE